MISVRASQLSGPVARRPAGRTPAIGTVASVNPPSMRKCYDAHGNRTSLRKRDGRTMGGTARTLGYDYDADGNRTRITHPDGSYFTYNYDGLDQVSSIYQNGTTGIMGFGYDSQSRLGHLYPINVGSSWLYDSVSRLSHIDYSFAGANGGVTLTYDHNPASQIVTKTRDNPSFSFNGYVNVSWAYASNGLNQYVSAGPASFGYDANGNLTGDGTRTYGYDVENRLVSASTGVSLDYDPTGRLWRVTAPSGTTQFLYDGNALVAEYDGSGNRTQSYVHAPGEDRPLLWYEGSAIGYGNLRSTAPDQQGSIIAVTNVAGTPLAINTYDEYGIPGSGNGGRFQYTGQAWLAELGMYYYKARIYSPTLGRFLQTDPIGYDDQNNLYAYVANDPVNMRHPSGEEGACFSTPGQCNNIGPQNIGPNLRALANLLEGAAEVANSIPDGALVGKPMSMLATIVRRAAPEVRAAIRPASSALSRVGLQKQLASKSQLSQLRSGGGTPMAGAGTSVPFDGAEKYAKFNGGSPSDYAKVTSSTFRAADGSTISTHAVRNVTTGELFTPKSIIEYPKVPIAQ